MKFSNAAKLKAAVKKIAVDSGVTAQGVLQKYVLERFLCRLAGSKYRNNFILKGGFLTSSLVGVANRTTMDIDATATGFSVTPMTVSFYVDVTTGDAITPKPVLQLFWSMFDDGDYELLSYNLETLLAEKLDTVLSRGVLNTRTRDFYDIDLLWNRYKKTVKMDILAEALYNTMSSRGNLKSLDDCEGILNSVISDDSMNNRWNKYQQEYVFAAGKTFSEVCDSALEILGTVVRK